MPGEYTSVLYPVHTSSQVIAVGSLPAGVIKDVCRLDFSVSGMWQ